MRCAPNVVRYRLLPIGIRVATVKGPVLLQVEQIEQGAGNAGKAREITDGRRIVVDAPDAAELGIQTTDTSRSLVEAFGAGTEPAKQMKVRENHVVEARGEIHRSFLLGCRRDHAERCEVGVEDGLLLHPLVGVLLAQRDHLPQDLGIEAGPLCLAVHILDVVGDGLLFFLQAFDAVDEGLELIARNAVHAFLSSFLPVECLDLSRRTGRGGAADSLCSHGARCALEFPLVQFGSQRHVRYSVLCCAGTGRRDFGR
ncbi:unknown [Sinorhizobium phage PBC5]|nr:unknown [Sinorhizobium phage PBC5]